MWKDSESDYSEPCHVELIDGAPALVIEGRRNWGAIVLYGLFLLPWTAGGVVVIVSLTRSFQWFVVLCLIFWLYGWLQAAAALAWQADGRDVVRRVDDRLEIKATALGLSWAKRYRIDHIRSLGVGPSEPDDTGSVSSGTLFVGQRRWGAVRFLNVWRPVYIAPSLHPEEAQPIVDEIRKLLPLRASEPLTKENFPDR